MVIFLPSLIPLAYFLRKAVKLKKYEKFSKLFKVAPEHPAFLRINAKTILEPGEDVPTYQVDGQRKLFC
ncbi:hypothetical protein COOONC_07411 [Cooperia oncophora]